MSRTKLVLCLYTGLQGDTLVGEATSESIADLTAWGEAAIGRPVDDLTAAFEVLNDDPHYPHEPVTFWEVVFYEDDQTLDLPAVRRPKGVLREFTRDQYADLIRRLIREGGYPMDPRDTCSSQSMRSWLIENL